jgi:YD repeat-containing protein
MTRNAKLYEASRCALSDGPGGQTARRFRRRASHLLAGWMLMIASVAAHPETSASYTYDALGRLISVVYTDGTKTTTVTYSYDASGNRTSLVAK